MAIKKGVKKKEGENLTPAHIEKVIGLLEAEKPITKKEACEILNIAYNTTRLGKIIDEYKEAIAEDARRRAANRGKPAAPHEVQTIIECFLDGDPLSEISARLYRPASLIKKVIDEVGVPEKCESYWTPCLLPDKCVSETFKVGQIVWCSRYGAMGIVRKYYPANEKREYDCYQVFVIEPIEETSPYFPQYQNYGGKFITQAWYDLGSLEHLKEFGIDIYKPYRATFKNWL